MVKVNQIKAEILYNKPKTLNLLARQFLFQIWPLILFKYPKMDTVLSNKTLCIAHRFSNMAQNNTDICISINGTSKSKFANVKELIMAMNFYKSGNLLNERPT
jgi:hypothetical protein